MHTLGAALLSLVLAAPPEESPPLFPAPPRLATTSAELAKLKKSNTFAAQRDQVVREADALLRDRLLFFVRDKTACKMAAYSFATGEVSAVAAAGNDQVGGSDKGATNFREAVYLPKDDLIMIGATGLIYDCGKNAWFKTAIPSDTPPITREGSYNIGVMYDPQRNLVWAVNTHSQVFVLRFDVRSAKLEEVK